MDLAVNAVERLSPAAWEETLRRLRDRVPGLRSVFYDAEPFPHAVVDGLFDATLLDAVAAEFPAPGTGGWRHWRSRYENKSDGLADDVAGPLARLFIQRLNGQAFLDEIEAVTGIPGLIADPRPMLHQARRGSVLGVHVDGNQSERTGLYRRLNLFLYLNRDWPESYAGELEFWNADATACVRRIAPAFNRLVVFAVTPTSHHGFTAPLACPEDRLRRAIGLRYFTAAMPDDGDALGDLPVFHAPPGGRLHRLRGRALEFVPPVLTDWLRRRRDRRP
jgi:hypothetical protein